MTNQEKLTLLKDQLQRIQNLPAHKLDQYLQQVYLNGWEQDITSWLNKAVEIRRKEVFKNIKIEDAMVVQEELSEVS